MNATPRPNGREHGSEVISILVVEDDRALREFLSTALSDELSVAVAVNGEEAFGVARQVQPDVVLLDVMLPGRSGLDVLRQLRADPQLRDVPVLVMTAFSDIEPGEAEAAGANSFLAKPFDLGELIDAIKELHGSDS
jgi:two-component system, OmpR family, response regulator